MASVMTHPCSARLRLRQKTDLKPETFLQTTQHKTLSQKLCNVGKVSKRKNTST